MNNNIKVFNHEQFGEVRTILHEDGSIWFDGNQVARILGYVKERNAIARHCKGALKHATLKNRGGYPLTIIPEPDLYRLIVSSQLPQAEKFEEWVFEEVLPSIRKHGAYMTDQTIDALADNPDLLIKIATNLKEEREERRRVEIEKQQAQQKLEEQKPLYEFGAMIRESDESCDIGIVSTLLQQNGVKNIGKNRFMKWLRNEGYLISCGARKNLPTQVSLEQELMEIKTSIYTDYTGMDRLSQKALITPKGMKYFLNKFLK